MLDQSDGLSIFEHDKFETHDVAFWHAAERCCIRVQKQHHDYLNTRRRPALC